MLIVVRTIFVAVFLSLLSLPMVQGVFAPFSFDAVQEHKARPMLPDGGMVERLWSDRTYARKVEEWFNATFPMRDLYIRSSNQIRYSLFNESKEVMVGSNGWITDKTVAESLKPIDNLTNEHLEFLHNRIRRFDSYLKSKGIKLVIVPVPLKNGIHRKDLTFPGLSRPEVLGYDRFFSILSNDPELSVINVQKVLLDVEQSGYQSFFKTDLHWTFPGAYAVGKEIVKTVNSFEDNKYPWNDDPVFTLDNSNTLGGDMISLALLKPIKEGAWGIDNSYKDYCFTKPITELKADFFLYESNIETCPQLLIPQSVMVGNSFMVYFHSSYYNRFEKLYRIHDLSYFPHLEEMIPQGTKYLIWQFFELQITHQLSNPDWWVWLDTAYPPTASPK